MPPTHPGPAIPGRLLRFGRNDTNDIRLPSGPAVVSKNGNANAGGGGHTYQNYRNDHFFFYLALSGELIIRELSHGRTTVELKNATPQGGYLGFNCSHVYTHTTNTRLNFLAQDNLKGADMLMYEIFRSLGLD
ncbi:hypothetical protein C8A05DRAFT_38375, partial [Staphylotrichum tortipilum]